MGFSYLLDPQVVQDVLADSSALRRIEALFETPATETSSEITKLLRKCESSQINEVYNQDLVASLTELKICFSHDCYIACLALSGKILEICLKQLLFDNDKKYGEADTIAGLLGNVRANLPTFYLDESLLNVGEIIRKNRNSAVHATGRIPVPSREQTIMVIYGVVDTVNRVIINAD